MTLLTRLTEKHAKLVWDDGCKQAFLVLKNRVQPLVLLHILVYPTRDISFILSMDTSDAGNRRSS